MTIHYSEFLEQKLAGNRPLRAVVDRAVADFGAWLQDSKLPFFPDYTDHGPEHLSQVLTTATALLSPQARPLFTASDAAILILGTLLHDSALHLSEAGFEQLIRGKAAHCRLDPFDTDPWPELWQNFLFSAKRWDDRKLCDVFGELEPGVPRARVRDPFEKYHDLSEGDRKLIGEFIRIHHPRMSHEFALFGVPGPTNDPIQLDPGLGPELRDLAGLLARSHGLPVRASLDYLSAKYHRREYRGVHTVYLMTLLRVADFFQIQAERAPRVVFRYKHIPSKVSQQEWKAHQAVRNITQTHDDPESVEIQARPEDVKTFLRLKDWLTGIQAELDASWAILGEVYGSHRDLCQLGLIIRRVRSNLDHEAQFAPTVNYVPRRIEFDVARPDLLKLLIGPLYGDKPEIGIRELVQNAVDAVRELRALQEKHAEFRRVQTVDQEGDVEVWLDDPDATGYAWLTVSDRGIGMTEEIVHQYFLKAGASYRHSDAWRREFETDPPPGDEEPKLRSRVLRSGRFGVGALAAFLLGEEIEVATRHVSALKGVRFKTRLDLEPIQLEYDDRLPVGTVIRLRLSPKVQEQMDKPMSSYSASANRKHWPRWDWYCLDAPRVRRLRGVQKQEIPQRYLLRAADFNGLSPLRKMTDGEYEAIYWTFEEKAPALNCNGLFITDSSRLMKFPRELSEDANYSFDHPKVCVLDPDAHLPLNLQRNGLTTRRYPFAEALFTDVLKDILAFLLAATPSRGTIADLSAVRSHPALKLKQTGPHPYHRYSSTYPYPGVHPWVITPEGLGAIDPWNLGQLAVQSVLVVVDGASTAFLPASGRKGHDVYFVGKFPSLERRSWDHSEEDPNESMEEFLQEILKKPHDEKGYAGISLCLGVPWRTWHTRGIRVLTSASWTPRVISAEESEDTLDEGESEDGPGDKEEKERNKRLTFLKESLHHEGDHKGWSMLATPRCPPTRISVRHLAELPPQKGKKERPPFAVELFLAEPMVPAEPGKLARLWRDIFQHPVIPFDLRKRRKVLASAYKVLEPYLAFHEAAAQTARTRQPPSPDEQE